MLSIFTIEEENKWDNIVKSFRNYDVYYLSSYVKAFQIHGDGDPLLFYYEDNNNRAINVVIQRDISKDKCFENKISEGLYYDITTPYGYGGFLIEGEASFDLNLNNFNEEYSSYCKRNGIVCEFVRFHPILKNTKHIENFYDITQLGKTVSIKLETKEQIWSDLTSKNRNMIRKALKEGVEIFWGRSYELYKEFIPLYNATMDKDYAREYYYFGENFYNSIINDLKYNSLMFYAIYKKKIISMSIVLFANQQMHYHLSASDKEYQNLAPTNLLLYEAASWGCVNGYNSFHLGGGLGGYEDSLYKFKSAFNRNADTSFSIGRKIFDIEKYNELVNIRSFSNENICNNRYFPLYRAKCEK
jgi:hypothetical protein